MLPHSGDPLDFVAQFQRAGSHGRAGQDEVALVEADPLRCVLDDLLYFKMHILGEIFLPCLVIDLYMANGTISSSYIS